jgi:hypothetical protein
MHAYKFLSCDSIMTITPLANKLPAHTGATKLQSDYNVGHYSECVSTKTSIQFLLFAWHSTVMGRIF